MKDCKKFETTIGRTKVIVETGKYAGQANGSVLVRAGDTVVMCNVTMSKQPKPGQDFFPLSVDFEEKMYSVGKIPGSYKRREGRPSDQAILTSRLIDRPLRPLFPKGFFHDVVVVCTALSVDYDIAPEPIAMFASSCALTISDIPFAGPTGSVDVACVDGEYIINPTVAEREKSTIDLTVAGTKDAILMVEAGAKVVSEEVMLKAILFAHEHIKKQVEFQEAMAKSLNVQKTDKVEYYVIPEDLTKDVREFSTSYIEDVMSYTDRHERDAREEEVDKIILDHFAEQYTDQEREILDVLYKIKKEVMRRKIIQKGIRPDGRKTTDIRPIWCETGILPRTHGSSVFTRGETQVMNIVTLGTASDAQEIEGLSLETEKRYMHQYNFPGYSTGEAKPLRTPGRREIGHGALAERALVPVLPSQEEFPYTIRAVSEVISSNGSTSQASVCASTLSLMDAGVPIKAPVAGIAMGLIKDEESGKVAVLTDIQGLEDFLGDMDFKVAGTKDGITAIQMDIKIKGIDENILRTALEQARQGRLHILQLMSEEIAEPRKQLSPFAPKIESFTIDPDKIKDVIGSGGKVINKIIEETGVKIDIEDDGLVMISSTDQDMIHRAKEIILGITEDVKVGKIYTATVEKIMPFGVFVKFCYNKEGMIHISKLSKERVEKVEDVVKIGDEIEVEVIKIDEKGRIDLRLVAKQQ